MAIAALRFWNEQSSIFEQLLQVQRALARCPSIPGNEGRLARLTESLAYVMSLARRPRPEIDDAWNAALRLAERSGDIGRLLSVMFGKAVILIYGGGNKQALVLLDRFKRLAAAEGDRGSLHDGERLATLANMHLGELVPVRKTLERLAEDLARGVAPSRTARYQKERYVSIHSTLAFTTWLTGHPRRALAMTEDMVLNLGSVDQPRGQSNVLVLVALPLALWSGHADALERHLASLRRNLDRENITLWEPVYRFYDGALRYSRGEPAAVAKMQSAVDTLVDDMVLMRTPMYQGVVAEALLDLGRTADAELAAERAFRLQRQSQEIWCLPELLRIKARILMGLGRNDAARDVAGQARDHAEKIGAKSLEARVLRDMRQIAIVDGDEDTAVALTSSLAACSEDENVALPRPAKPTVTIDGADGVLLPGVRPASSPYEQSSVTPVARVNSVETF